MNPGLVVKLRPAGPWRIGTDSGARNRVDVIYHSDSLYSAVASAMARLGSLDEWLDATARVRATAHSGVPAVSFSSCFPFLDEIDFVVPPRTVWPPTSPALMSARVRWKSARFIPKSVVQAMLAGEALDGNQWSLDGASQCLVPAGSPGPFRTGVRWSAAVDRLTGAVERHSTACIEFRPGAGLWTIVSFQDEAAHSRWLGPIKAAFRLLADTGFGGERSRGWGRSEPPEFIEGTLPELVLGAAPRKAAPEPLVAEPTVAEPAPPEPEGPITAEVRADPALLALEQPPVAEPVLAEAEAPIATTPVAEPVPPAADKPLVTEPAAAEAEAPIAAEPVAEPVPPAAVGPLVTEPAATEAEAPIVAEPIAEPVPPAADEPPVVEPAPAEPEVPSAAEPVAELAPPAPDEPPVIESAPSEPEIPIAAEPVVETAPPAPGPRPPAPRVGPRPRAPAPLCSPRRRTIPWTGVAGTMSCWPVAAAWTARLAPASSRRKSRWWRKDRCCAPRPRRAGRPPTWLPTASPTRCSAPDSRFPYRCLALLPCPALAR
jgi:CRISPR type III-A-associated RAMP protein Csm4